MTESTKGVIAMACACVIWWLSSIYYAFLRHVPPLEVLAYRGLWSLVFFAGILLVQGRVHMVGRALGTKKGFALTCLSAALIASNWFWFIYAIQTGQATEGSLGYYIFPLVAVVLGRVIFGEVLARAQIAAVVLAVIAVAVLTVGLGAAPWIALVLASTFAAYWVLKKQLDVGPVVSVTAEVLVFAPFALVYLSLWGGGAGNDKTWDTHLLLALSGPLTATPLILFSYAARRARLSTLGLVQYLNPTLQFFCAVVIFSEPFTPWHALAFPAIWLALVIYSASALRQDRAARRATSRPATSVADVT